MELEERVNETYTWLNRSRRCDSEIRRMERKIEELKSCLLTGGIDYSRDKVNSSPDDMMSKIFAEIDETERMIKEKSIERGFQVSEISSAIESIDNDLQKNVLTEFFISKKSVFKIAEEMNYDRSWINKQKKEGVRKVASLRGDIDEVVQ